jgi:TIR domain
MGNLNTPSRMAARELPEKFLVAFSFAGEQRDLVRAIAEALEKKIGSDNVFFDEWFEYYIAGDDADLKLQAIYGKQCELAVVCVSESFGGKPWTRAEHRAIRARLMKSGESAGEREQLAILPVRVGVGDVQGVLFNAIVPDVRDWAPERTAQFIVDRLRLIRPDLWFWPEPREPLPWPMADHSGVREAFARLLTPDPPWRLLPILGPTETGKSHITNQMLDNALLIPKLACGRFDFKGTTDMDAEVSTFVQHLGVPVPPANMRLTERLRHIIDALRQRAWPALLVFDTYEAAGDARDWVERQLLPSLIRAPWLRVVIAGQRVPPFAGAVAREPLQLVPPQPAEWFEYGKQYHPDLTLAKVEIACDLARNKASLLAQLLGPTT